MCLGCSLWINTRGEGVCACCLSMGTKVRAGDWNNWVESRVWVLSTEQRFSIFAHFTCILENHRNNFLPFKSVSSLLGVLHAAAKSLQSCPTLCDPIDGSPPGSPFPGTLQARTLEWVAISFSSAWKEK